MRTFVMSRKWRTAGFLAGLFCVILLPACSKPFVEVAVNVTSPCPSGDGEVGACQKNTIVVATPVNANTYLTDGINKAPANYRCVSGSKMCKTAPGSCNLSGTPKCRTYWLGQASGAPAGDGICTCDCFDAFP